MKPRLQLARARGKRASAFTLAEIMVTMAIFLIMITAIITGHLYGIRMFEFIKPKLNASDEARTLISKLLDEVRTASQVKVGSATISNFTEAAVNTLQQGSAIEIYPTTNNTPFIRYFWEASDQKLKRCTNGQNTASIMASSVTNALVFSAEDFAGQILTNHQHNRTVIGLTLRFSQLQYPAAKAGSGFYDYYELRTRITKR